MQKKREQITKNRSRMRFRRQDASRRCFLSIVLIFGRILEAPGPPKMDPKSQKNAKNWLKNNVKNKIVLKYPFLLIFW